MSLGDGQNKNKKSNKKSNVTQVTFLTADLEAVHGGEEGTLLTPEPNNQTLLFVAETATI